ncbi:Fic family protein [Oceanivirga miroungae]|uniref:Adenosine monophosphate-protein transferase SoFic n=1 Tax=Oceanivirga miroungae TaxID=1130046 RepID=A0A6I8M636_9FUSO|nr:Fic family protein [Oceanivirga miroungae]VWL84882.1 Adenosine monophosphate-protein transferase SoFic [Oceanivirga miroungae]
MDSLRAGEYISNLSGKLEYKSYRPAKLPIEIEYDNELEDLIKKAYEKLEKLNELEIDIVLEGQIIKKEVFFSTKIESEKTNDDIFDKHYVQAIRYAIQRIKTFPLSNRLIQEINAVLLNNKKYSGEFRKSQNWVGDAKSTIKTAIYIPPNAFDMTEAMNNLEIYINDEELKEDNLVKLALIHYQLDAINPFVEGNSKIVRMISTLFLIDKKIITNFCIPFSYYIDREITQYYGRMRMIKETGDFEQFIKFFIRMLINAIDETLDTVKTISKIKEKNMKIIEEDEALKRAYRRFEKELVIKSDETDEIKKLEELGIIKKLDENMYSLENYMDELKIWL